MPSSRPTRRLPARVYWFRRALVLGSVLALVVAMSRILTGSPEADPEATATTVADTPAPPAVAGPMGPTALQTGKASPTRTPPSTVLAQPDGPCTLDEITATPVAGTPKAGASVALTLELTGIRPACTFEVSADSLVAKITAGSKRVWSSQDCPHAIKTSSVVVRSGTPTAVQVTWSGRYSDAQCSRAAAWALPGNYQVVGAVIGSEPSQVAFKLTSPPRPVVTKTITPKPRTKVSSRPASRPTGKAIVDSGRRQR